jgi:hypothetical protein
VGWGGVAWGGGRGGGELRWGDCVGRAPRPSPDPLAVGGPHLGPELDRGRAPLRRLGDRRAPGVERRALRLQQPPRGDKGGAVRHEATTAGILPARYLGRPWLDLLARRRLGGPSVARRRLLRCRRRSAAHPGSLRVASMRQHHRVVAAAVVAVEEGRGCRYKTYTIGDGPARVSPESVGGRRQRAAHAEHITGSHMPCRRLQLPHPTPQQPLSPWHPASRCHSDLLICSIAIIIIIVPRGCPTSSTSSTRRV